MFILVLFEYTCNFEFILSTLYWTERDGRISSYGRALKYLHLSNIDVISSIPLGEGQTISKLTLEPYSRSLYWISHSSNGSSSIERYSIVDGSTTTVIGDASGVEALAASSVNEAVFEENIISYVYWYNRLTSLFTGSTQALVKWGST